MARCNDPASQANPTKAAATHAALILDVDFDTRVIRGSVEYTVEIQVWPTFGERGAAGGRGEGLLIHKLNKLGGRAWSEARMVFGEWP